jgi:protein phosphatase-4 regulatory subunit 3
MVDVKFISRATHFVPYPLLREIAAGRVTQSAGIEYIDEEGMREIKGNFMGWSWLELFNVIHTDMDLVHRGRLSVQRVQPGAWNAVEQLAAQGGWSEGIGKSKKRKEGVEEKRGKKKRTRRDMSGPINKF